MTIQPEPVCVNKGVLTQPHSSLGAVWDAFMQKRSSCNGLMAQDSKIPATHPCRKRWLTPNWLEAKLKSVWVRVWEQLEQKGNPWTTVTAMHTVKDILCLSPMHMLLTHRCVSTCVAFLPTLSTSLEPLLTLTELFQILKDDAGKELHSICQQIWESQQWPQDWKRSVSIPIPKKGNAKECSNYHTTAFNSHTSKVMLKILQVRLQHYMNGELPDVQAGFRKGRGTRDQIADICWIIEKAREFQKNI